MDEKEHFNAEKFVDVLLSEGAIASCDDTVTSFNRSDLPPYYNKELYERGTKFFRNNSFSIVFGKILGLISLLLVPSVIKILIFTKKSGSPVTAYRRYLATLLHMCLWYEGDFSTNSKLWKSINEVKNYHNTVSNRLCNKIHRINQRDMALTQFASIGYTLIRPEKVGLHNVHDNDWKGFVHIWRVVGYLLGMEDRFNICRDNVDETREICNILVDRVFRPNFAHTDRDFEIMSKFLVDGVWAISPMISYNSIMLILQETMQPINKHNNNNNNNNNDDMKKIKLSLYDKFLYYLTICIMWSMQFTLIHSCIQYVDTLAMFIRRNFPLLAYYKFGYADSQVKVPK